MKSARRKVLESVSAFAFLVAFVVSKPVAFAAEVAADDAREAVLGWFALGEALTGTERFAGAEIADVKKLLGTVPAKRAVCRRAVGKFDFRYSLFRGHIW